MMFVGYTENREHDSVRMWNPETNGIWTSCDAIWLKRFHFDRIQDDDIVLFKHHGEAEEEVHKKSLKMLRKLKLNLRPKKEAQSKR
jgi:hypothetical protein